MSKTAVTLSGERIVDRSEAAPLFIEVAAVARRYHRGRAVEGKNIELIELLTDDERDFWSQLAAQGRAPDLPQQLGK